MWKDLSKGDEFRVWWILQQGLLKQRNALNQNQVLIHFLYNRRRRIMDRGISHPLAQSNTNLFLLSFFPHKQFEFHVLSPPGIKVINLTLKSWLSSQMVVTTWSFKAVLHFAVIPKLVSFSFMSAAPIMRGLNGFVFPWRSYDDFQSYESYFWSHKKSMTPTCSIPCLSV